MEHHKQGWAKDKLQHYTIPLYTAPQTKPLSDEEILNVYNHCFETMDSVKIVDFARAIEKAHGIL